MKVGSQLSRTESAWMVRLAKGIVLLQGPRHQAVARIVRRGLAKVETVRVDKRTVRRVLVRA